MTPGVSVPPPAGKDQSENKINSNQCPPPPPPPRNIRSNENRNKRKIDDHGRTRSSQGFQGPPQWRNNNHRGRGDMRNNRGRPHGPGRNSQRDRRNMGNPGFHRGHNQRGMNNRPMGPGPNNLPPPSHRINNGNYGPAHHGHGPGNGQRIPPPPPHRMGNGNNGEHMHSQFGRGGPPPPPPKRMNQNYGPPSFHGPGSSPRQQQYAPQNSIPNGPNQQLPYSYSQHSLNPKSSYESMGNQPLMQQPSIPVGQLQYGLPSGQNLGLHQPTLGLSGVPLNPNDTVSNWSIHQSPTGVEYFYNSVTRESTYNRPPCLGPVKAISKKAPGSHIPAASTQILPKEKKSKNGWTEHTDNGTGKVYYYNGTITTWEKPDNFDDDSTDDSSENVSTKRKKKKVENTVLYNNKAEAIAAFKGLLLAKAISPTMKWNDVVKICSSDHRWEACSTAGERRQSLAEYQTRRANTLREEKRQEKMRAKDAFMSLLTDILPSIGGFNSSASASFQDIRDSISKDDRFHAVEQEERREELYLDFVEELRKRDERQRRGRKKEAKEAFLAFLKSIELLTYTSTWPSFLKTLDENEKVDPRFVISPYMSDSERQLFFTDYVIDLQSIEDEKRRRIREARRRAEKAQREAFRESLRKYAKEGKILPTSRWRNVEEALSVEDSFGPVKEQDRNEPRNIFDDFIEEWAEIYHGDKSFLNDLLAKSKDTLLSTDTKYENFTKALLDSAAFSPDAYSDVRRVINDEIPISSAKIFFDEIVASGKFGGNRARSGGHNGRRKAEESSEDEGEIVEDGELSTDNNIQETETTAEDSLLPSEATDANVEGLC